MWQLPGSTGCPFISLNIEKQHPVNPFSTAESALWKPRVEALVAAMRVGMKPSEASELFVAFDADGDGAINEMEFMKARGFWGETIQDVFCWFRFGGVGGFYLPSRFSFCGCLFWHMFREVGGILEKMGSTATKDRGNPNPNKKQPAKLVPSVTKAPNKQCDKQLTIKQTKPTNNFPSKEARKKAKAAKNASQVESQHFRGQIAMEHAHILGYIT